MSLNVDLVYTETEFQLERIGDALTMLALRESFPKESSIRIEVRHAVRQRILDRERKHHDPKEGT